ncbi:hypothetical protein [Oleiagrimonas sp. C23AA]|uniref:NMCC_0638 family (lipo)protein n=1 Tax=Oleiagrimonas sp. C23AA TaxID=2719047 RepID=UPI00141F723D|nr:hypothetical protein [Oleiagrimonas sp. C23AA]NII10354.1 hypothetical protein [Oleiagrimonas sp. C23AA]
MRPILVFAALSLTALAVPHPACATDNASAESAAVQLFAEACLTHYPHESDFSDWLAQQHFPRAAPAMTSTLTGKRGGRAFAVSRNGHHLLLVAEWGNLCSVYARRADAAQARAAVASLREGLREPGTLQESAHEQTRRTREGTLNITQWTYTNKAAVPVLALSLSTSDSTHGLYQMAVSASVAARHALPASDGPGKPSSD